MYSLDNRSLLTSHSREWNFDTDGDPRSLKSIMLSMMMEEKGIGLAANQIGLDRRIFVIGHDNIAGFIKPTLVINPKILKYSSEKELYKERCLSFPRLELSISRPKTIEVEYFDETGKLIQGTLDGLSSRCFQHEYDHLDGVCFVDKVSQLKLNLAMKKLRKITK